MIERGIINTKSLRQNFSDVYKNFFSKCEIVISSDDSFFWAGEYSRFFGGLAITQKMPLKAYVGLESTHEGNLGFGDTIGYNPATNQFSQIVLDEAKGQRLLNFLKSYLKSLPAGRKNGRGFIIHILSEAPTGGGLGSTGVVCACLATAISLYFNWIRMEDVREWPNRQSIQAFKDDKSLDQTFRLAWRLTAIMRNCQSSGTNSFGAFQYTPYPIVYCAEDAEKIVANSAQINDENSSSSCRIVELLNYWGGGVDTLFKFTSPISWPIDFGLINSGVKVNTENILKSINRIKTSMNTLRNYVSGEMDEVLKFSQSTTQPFFYQLAEHKDRDEYWNSYIGIINITTFKILLAMRSLFEDGSSESALRNFFQSLNQAQNIMHFINASPLIDRICAYIHESAQKMIDDVGVGVKPSAFGPGGHVLFTVPNYGFREFVDNVVTELQDKVNNNVWLDWASWEDGYGRDGLKVEQFLNQKIYSPFVAESAIHIKIWQTDKPAQSKLMTEEQLKTEMANIDILLDKNQGEVYFRGIKVGAGELHSIRATIEIMKILLEQSKKTLPAEKLPAYGNSRYDLQGKVVKPLIEATKKYLKKQLPLKIKGGTYQDYQLILEPCDLSFGFIEKVM